VGILGGQLPLPPLPPPKTFDSKSTSSILPVVKTSPKPIYVTGEIQEAKLIHKVMVTYPQSAVRARISGTVILQINVDENGDVTDVQIISGHALLITAAREAVYQWKYSPTILYGQLYPVIATVAVNFELR
jgi:protein TonB